MEVQKLSKSVKICKVIAKSLLSAFSWTVLNMFKTVALHRYKTK